MAVASEGFRMNRNLWTQIHQTEMFSPPLQVPSQGMDQSVIKINTKNDENKEVLHTAVTARLIKPSAVALNEYQTIPKQLQLHPLKC